MGKGLHLGGEGTLRGGISHWTCNSCSRSWQGELSQFEVAEIVLILCSLIQHMIHTLRYSVKYGLTIQLLYINIGIYAILKLT